MIRLLKSHWLETLVLAYIGTSVLTDAFFGVDVGLPCLIRAATGWECIGCGLTTAAVAVVKLDLSGAWRANPLIFLVVVGVGWHLVQVVKAARRRYRTGVAQARE